jgi:anthranilate synthase/aminodeoxychorismate synthase-like glutamine amidotransferase
MSCDGYPNVLNSKVHSDKSDCVVVIDNYDSFVFNLARYFEQLGQRTHVVRNDSVDVAAMRRLKPKAIVISPGPGRPADAGVSLDIVRQLHRDVPILGVCLGHQVIAEALGGRVIHAAEPIHGRASSLLHSGESVFRGLPSPLRVGRYHSLIADADVLPNDLVVTARTEDGTIMGIAHQAFNVVGLQFHPESILTEHGYTLLANFLRQSGIDVSANASRLDQSNTPRAVAAEPPPTTPVTF